jgi:hypothetical protein
MAKKKSQDVSAMAAFIREQGYEASETDDRADWRVIDQSLLLGAVYALTSQHAAILFGSDRNGFLFSVTVYAGGEKATKYFHPTREVEKLEEYLRSLIEYAESIS